MESILSYMAEYDYENLVFCQDTGVGLRAIIAIHDTTLGPAAGGCRMWTYATEMDAIEDALRLARGMTYKYAAAGVNLGGGKCVVVGNPATDKSEALFRALGRFIDRLGGTYMTGEDVGTTLRDMEYMRMETPYVITLPKELGGAGNIAPATARGTLQGMRAACIAAFGSGELGGRSVALQGLGMVGKEVLALLRAEGAIVYVADLDGQRAEELAARHGATVVSPESIHSLDADIYSPCALGAVINDATIGQLRCKVVAGCANNQLARIEHGDLLQQRGIIYAPDYIINAGGAIYDADRLQPGGFNQQRALEHVDRIFETMTNLIAISRREGISTARAADRLAEERLAGVRKAQRVRPNVRIAM
ncbi:MAG TPA: Glu/Leu/Phe/Val dehydrogenase dimerization domain-containing protein [Chloroflexota bacterium]|nr:Glu/Leu/Phe/Val dehydrogenase dimerization domain-containing protein [Chloroflexota bacterium]